MPSSVTLQFGTALRRECLERGVKGDKQAARERNDADHLDLVIIALPPSQPSATCRILKRSGFESAPFLTPLGFLSFAMSANDYYNNQGKQYYPPQGPPPGQGGYYPQQPQQAYYGGGPPQGYPQQGGYQPQPTPQTVYVQQPQQSSSSGGCGACLAGMCLCCCAEELCECLL
ncbi:hypothetical protein GGU10DRAFT_401691 [Lentinula aff. detonsa]|uniref:Cysteine-rich transmembrane domain-containing protein n=1 Tax=Lentinula aff. detonsa TaxID=2804958 RepID=A0AA38L4Y7_9AGAR|nr:hypothetical protein GGU10DRAFT_401691 [Lentinula aff. detonsa]